MFDNRSRYWDIPVTTTMIDGRTVTYVQRRFIPAADTLPLRATYIARREDRSDRVAAAQLQDPLQYWQLLDANGVVRDEDLLRPGRQIRIPWPATSGGGAGG